MKGQCPSEGIATYNWRSATSYFSDVVGYSKLPVDDQREVLAELNSTVRTSKTFIEAEQAGKLIRLPTGDGVALAFFNTPEAPVRCATEVANALRNHPRVQVRMGIHSGPVSAVTDVNDQSNVAGAGIIRLAVSGEERGGGADFESVS